MTANDAPRADARELAGMLEGLVSAPVLVIAAGHHDEDLGLGRRDVLPGQRLGGLAGHPERRLPRRRARSAGVSSARPRRRGRATRSPRPEGGCGRAPRGAPGRRAPRPGDQVDARRRGVPVACAMVRTSPRVSPSVFGSRAITRGFVGSSGAIVCDLVIGDGAHGAQGLCDDQIRLQPREGHAVELVDGLALERALAHGSVDLRRAQAGGQHVARSPTAGPAPPRDGRTRGSRRRPRGRGRGRTAARSHGARD